MRGVLEWPGHKWVQRREKNLTFQLWHHPIRPERLSLGIQVMFVPAGIDEEEEEGACRNLYLDLRVSVPRLGDWRDIIGMRLEGEASKLNEETGSIEPGQESPEIELWSLGSGEGSMRTHGQEFWHTSLEFGPPVSSDGFELPITVEAFQPSQRARQARLELLDAEIRAVFGQPVPYDADRDERMKEGWWLRYADTVYFEKVFCLVPVNAPRPVELARAIAKRELNLTEFGRCRVNGSRTWDERFQPEDGVSGAGRLVILNPLTDYWKEWLARKKP